MNTKDRLREDLTSSMETNYKPERLDPRVNAYICPECKGRILSVDCADGTTPMSLPCFAQEGRQGNVFTMGGVPAKPQCRGTMISQWYSLAPSDYEMGEVKYEWRLPSIERYAEMKAKEAGLASHVLHGGLILHNRTDAPVLTHGGVFVQGGLELEGEALAAVLGPFALLRDLVEKETAVRKEIKRKADHSELMRHHREKRKAKDRRRK